MQWQLRPAAPVQQTIWLETPEGIELLSEQERSEINQLPWKINQQLALAAFGWEDFSAYQLSWDADQYSQILTNLHDTIVRESWSSPGIYLDEDSRSGVICLTHPKFGYVGFVFSYQEETGRYQIDREQQTQGVVVAFQNYVYKFKDYVYKENGFAGG